MSRCSTGVASWRCPAAATRRTWTRTSASSDSTSLLATSHASFPGTVETGTSVSDYRPQNADDPVQGVPPDSPHRGSAVRALPRRDRQTARKAVPRRVRKPAGLYDMLPARNMIEWIISADVGVVAVEDTEEVGARETTQR